MFVAIAVVVVLLAVIIVVRQQRASRSPDENMVIHSYDTARQKYEYVAPQDEKLETMIYPIPDGVNPTYEEPVTNYANPTEINNDNDDGYIDTTEEPAYSVDTLTDTQEEIDNILNNQPMYDYASRENENPIPEDVEYGSY
jgi:hypothetical protein